LEQPKLLFEGKYEILAKIREGGMGTIYKVRHRLLDEIRVVKIMRPHVVADEDLKRRFLEEAKIAIRLKHPNLCSIHDFAADEGGTAYLVMEHIDGANLADLLKSRGPFSPSLAIEIGHQSLLALGYLHRKGVIHRDIAPDNLMLTHDEEGRPSVKLIDLGIAKALNRVDMTATGVFLGKLKYASPEQFGSLSPGEKLDGRSDLYGLGVVLYEILTGMRPYKAESPAELLRAHLVEQPIAFSESDRDGRVPPELRTVVLRSLEKKREQRYATAEDFDRDMAKLLGRFDTARDLETTASILSSARLTRPSGAENVTPSAQDRLDLNFGAHTTPLPGPSSSPLKIVSTPGAMDPTIAVPGENDPTVRAPSTPELEAKAGKAPARPAEKAKGPSAKAATAPERPKPKPEGPITTPLPPKTVEEAARPPSRARLYAAVAAAVVIALAIWRPWSSRNPPEEQIAGAPSPAAAVSPAGSSGAPAAEAPTAAPTSVPTAAPTAAPTAVPTRADAAERPLAEAARANAERAREAAERAQAPDFASGTYRRAAAMRAEGSRLAARGAWAGALRAFDAAGNLYADAANAARLQALKAATATPVRVAEIPPTAIPRPTAVPIPTAAQEAALAPAVERKAAIPPTAPKSEGPGAAADREQITKVVGDYAWAQTTQDEKMFAQVFPNGIDNFKLTFKNLKTQNVRLDIRSIDLQGSRATVLAHEVIVAKPRAGDEVRNEANVTLQLEKSGDRWVIVGRH
jgi:eukaryotic-like serine/threonine-protein kinase